VNAVIVALLLSAAPDAGVLPGAKDAPRGAAPNVLGAMKGFSRSGHEGVTACAACHGTGSWTEVRFNHERTGFSLTGRHARTTCRACHVTDFSVPLPRTCGACHRDVHAGELGARCEGCHDTTDWRSRFDVDAHRRTNFPLFGAHAALPCVECHAEARERRFSRSTVDCQACHQQDVLRTTSMDKPVNHVALGLDQKNCRECHNPLSFTPARFPTHDECFPISAGSHAGVACLNCHTSLMGGVTMKCGTNTAQCTHCHSNDGTGNQRISHTDQQHPADKVPGYVWLDRRCLDCHFPRGGAAP
jgi:hypothetical protein